MKYRLFVKNCTFHKMSSIKVGNADIEAFGMYRVLRCLVSDTDCKIWQSI